jgi:hypothetical protein
MIGIGRSGVHRYWSMMDMMKVDDCCDTSFVGTLAPVNLREYVY